ncbi:MAG: hypothetical protein R3325_07890 [Thermoanaerobaculia bacterium]|nr:hypothetical protein [Thermoanaerobaculia bacterium]
MSRPGRAARRRLSAGSVGGAALLLLLAAPRPADAAACDDGGLQPVARPKLAVLTYFWHKPKQFQCTRIVPRGGPVDSADTGWGGYYHRRFRRLKEHGVDVLGFVFTGFAPPDPAVDGSRPSTEFDGENLAAAVPLARDVGLPFFLYYDLKVRTAAKSLRCRVADPAGTPCRNPKHKPLRNFELKKRVLFRQLRDDFLRIKDDLILPNLDSYYMLEDEAGRPILDERGLPRPVIGIYIARNLEPDRRLEKLVQVVTRAYRRDGLGQPAFLLDAIWWYDQEHDEVHECVDPDEEVVSDRLLDRFGGSVAAVTSFFPVGAAHAEKCGIETMRRWAPAMSGLYAEAAAELDERPGSTVSIWPGIAAMFDNRRRDRRQCELEREPTTVRAAWLIDGPGDWRRLLRMAYDAARAPAACVSPDEPGPIRPQALVVNYDNEFRESAVTDCVRTQGGEAVYPYRYGCELLEVVREEDRWPGR